MERDIVFGAGPCPACGSAALAPTGRTVDLDDVMRRWVAAGAKISQRTIERYSTKVCGALMLHACPQCGFGHFQPIMVGDSSFYESVTETEYYNAEKWEFERAEAIIAAHGARSVLDFGCGSGYFLDRLRARSGGKIDVVGVEANESAASQAKAKGLTVHCRNFAENDVQGLPSADVVSAFQVLEHVSDPLAFLADLFGLARPGGLVVVGVPDTEGLISRHWNALTELPPHHVTYWTERSLRSAFSRIGLETILVEKEPLTKVLWDGYFPDVWANGAWPARYGRAAAKLLAEPGEGMGWVARKLSDVGMTALHGVGGHSMLAVGRRPKTGGRAEALRV